MNRYRGSNLGKSKHGRHAVAVTAAVLAMGWMPQAQSRESLGPRDSAISAAIKTAETQIEAHLNRDLTAAKQCYTKESLRKYKEFFTLDNLEGARPATALLTITKAHRVKDQIVVRLRTDPTKAITPAQKEMAQMLASKAIHLCLVAENKSWKIDVDSSNQHQERYEKRQSRSQACDLTRPLD